MPIFTLVIFHYHLLPGGVRSSLAGGLQALSRLPAARAWQVRLLVGRKAGAADFAANLAATGIAVETVVDSQLDYTERQWPDAATFRSECRQLARRLLSHAAGDTLFWVHNPTLGKNPLVTAAWAEAAVLAEAEKAPHRFLYHIHDFAECGRMENLRRLRTCWTSGGIDAWYPAAGNVGYATLNRADGERLILAGIARERVFYLPNAVTPGPAVEPASKTIDAIAAAVARFADREGYRFDRQLPWWILPIRLIRRKNVLEALVLARLAEASPQLLVTLDASSAQERPYAEAVKDLVRRGRHGVVIGFGDELVGSAFALSELLAAGRVVATTSLLEGFGFAFLEGPLHGTPLMGRNLTDITRDFQPAGFPAKGLYEELLVPLDKAEGRRLRILAVKLMENLHALGMTSSGFLAALQQKLAGYYESEWVDFGRLDLPAQLKVVSRLKHPAFVADLQRMNPHLPSSVDFPPDFPARLLSNFGPDAYAARFSDCLHRLFQEDRTSTADAGGIGGRIMEQFLTPRHLRALLGGWS